MNHQKDSLNQRTNSLNQRKDLLKQRVILGIVGKEKKATQINELPLVLLLVRLSIDYLLTLNLVSPSLMKDTIWFAAAIPAFRFASAVCAPIFFGEAKTLGAN